MSAEYVRGLRKDGQMIHERRSDEKEDEMEEMGRSRTTKWNQKEGK